MPGSAAYCSKHVRDITDDLYEFAKKSHTEYFQLEALNYSRCLFRDSPGGLSLLRLSW